MVTRDCYSNMGGRRWPCQPGRLRVYCLGRIISTQTGGKSHYWSCSMQWELSPVNIRRCGHLFVQNLVTKLNLLSEATTHRVLLSLGADVDNLSRFKHGMLVLKGYTSYCEASSHYWHIPLTRTWSCKSTTQCAQCPGDRLSYDVLYRAVATEAASYLVTNGSWPLSCSVLMLVPLISERLSVYGEHDTHPQHHQRHGDRVLRCG